MSFTLEDYVYGAVLSHVSWQQIATTPTYRIAEFEDKLEYATGVRLDKALVDRVVSRMDGDGFATLVENDVIGAYLKINYKPIYEYVAARSEDSATPEAQYRLIGKRLLFDLLGSDGDGEKLDVVDSPPPILTEENAAKLVTEVSSVVEKLDELPIANAEKAQVRSLLLAAQNLAEAPEPPVSLIWDLVNRANSIAGIASLLVTIIALFV